MTKQEFTRWLNQHMIAFPRVVEYFAAGGRELRDLWQSALEDLSYDEAVVGTQAILSGESKAFGVESHPAAIRSHIAIVRHQKAEETRPRYVGGEITYDCGKCLDSGTVSVYAPGTIRFVRDNRHLITDGITRLEDRKYIRSHAVACECVKGDKWREPVKHYRRLPTYQAGEMVLCRDQVGVDVSPILEHLAGVADGRKEAAFSDWNGGEV